MLGTGPGRQKAAPGPILGRPGRAKSAREPSKSLPGPAPRRSQTTSERCPSAFKAPGPVEHARGTIFHRFCTIARMLRSASRYSFYSVLWACDEVSKARARTAKNLENPGVSASKIEPGSARATQNRARAARIERQNAKRRAMLSDFFLKWARASQQSAKVRR